MSVSPFSAYFLSEMRPLYVYLLVWRSYLSEFFWRHSLDTFSSAFALWSMYGNLLSWKKYFSEIFGDISWMFLHYFPMITYFLYVCQFFSWLTSLLKLGQYRYISWSGGVIFLNFFGDIPWILLALPLPLGQI